MARAAGHAVEQIVARGNHHFGGGRGRGRAQIGHEIGDGHIRLMSHRRDHRHRAGRNRARYGLLVEGPQVFERSAAAPHDHQFRPLRAAEVLDAAADLLHRSFALHQRREDADMQPGKAARENLEHVGDGGAARRGDDADAPRKARQGPLALGREQALGGQLLLELLESQLQRAQPLGLERLHQQLVFAARLVDVDAAARQHRQAVLRLEFPVAVRGAESHALHLGVAFLEGEVVVAAGGQLQAGDLAGDPDILEALVERRADGRVQFGDRIDAALGRQREIQRKLLHRAMVSRLAKGAGRSPASPDKVRFRMIWRANATRFVVHMEWKQRVPTSFCTRLGCSRGTLR